MATFPVNRSDLVIFWGERVYFSKFSSASSSFPGHEASLARAFPDALVAPDGRKSWGRHLSGRLRQKPRPPGRRTGSVHEDASRTTSQRPRYRVPRSSCVLGRPWEPKIRISTIDFVVKTTQRSKVAPFDLLFHICRLHCAAPALIRPGSYQDPTSLTGGAGI
mgnify:CR=1 FL=1